jgi:Cd2+/Zn2+-exporting ATPase
MMARHAGSGAASTPWPSTRRARSPSGRPGWSRRALNGLAETDVLRLAAIAEKYSEHPLGQSVVRAARERGLLVADPDDFETLPGLGVRARTDGHEIVLGRGTLPAERGMPLSPDLQTRLTTLATAWRTVIPVAINTEVAGLLVLEDELRPDALNASRV